MYKAIKKKELGKKYIVQGNYSKALKYLNESIEIDNKDFEALILRGNVKFSLYNFKNFNEVIEDYKIAEERGGSFIHRFILLTKSHLILDPPDYKTAINNISFLIEKIPLEDYQKKNLKIFAIKQAILFKFRGDCYIQNDQVQLGIQDLTTFVNLLKKDLSFKEISSELIYATHISDLFFETYLQLGNLHAELNNFTESIAAYEYVLKNVKDDIYFSGNDEGDTEIKCRLNIAHIHEKNCNYQKAIFQFSELISKFPYTDDFYNERARVKNFFKDLEGSKKDLKIAKILKKSVSEEPLKGKSQEIELLNDLIKVDSENIIFLNERAALFSEIKDFELAIIDYSKLIKLNPNNWNYYKERAIIFIKIDNKKSALEDLSKAISINPKNSALYILRSHLFKENKKFNDAIKDILLFQKHSETNKAKVGCYPALAKLEIEKNFKKEDIKNYKKALEYCEKYISYKSNQSLGYAYKCIIFTKCGIPKEDFETDILKAFDSQASDWNESDDILIELLNEKEFVIISEFAIKKRIDNKMNEISKKNDNFLVRKRESNRSWWKGLIQDFFE